MSILAAHRATFRAIARTVVPEAAQLDETGWSELEATVEHALAGRPPRMQRQLRVLLRMIEQLPRVTTGRSFSSLDETSRTAFLDRLQHSPVKLIRRGIWGVRTLTLMGFYTRADAARSVGYRADARGWLARESVR